ncbi:MAG: amino acid ABC transporter ATP-binding protein [Oscillospiraceae bacterium]|nr:amino acid ABC transporter ATP-binding protein [Oscillospiraceae bacterium]
MIEIKNLYKSFGDQEILKGVSAKINKGDKIVILGPSGCGKSTLLRCINLLERPSSGQILFNNINITQKNININKIRAQMGMVFQNFNLFPHLNILKNITLAPTTLKIKTSLQAQKQAIDLLKKIGLADKLKSYPSQLSGGQKQRIAIIRALAMNPEIMLLDEPTSALDPKMTGEVLDLIRDISQKSNMTMVIVTHELSFARDIANKIFFMQGGLILENSSAKEFFNNPKTDQAKDFLNLI